MVGEDKRQVVIDGSPLHPADVAAVAERTTPVVAGSDLAARMGPSQSFVSDVLAEDRTVYGITTGFGALASTHIPPAEAADLQVALVRSHAAGVGPPLAPELVRAMLLLRARTLSQGHSGVRPVIVERLIEFLRRDLLPVVPAQGSVGASGDLAPFAHLALPVIGEGQLWRNGIVTSAADALAAEELDPLVLQAKEGLALLNGTEGMLAMGVLNHRDGVRLANAADLACALSIEALMGSARPFEARVHKLRPHPGQMDSAARIAALIAGSEIGSSHADDFVHAVQDAYSLRCAPQVHGAVHDTLTFVNGVFRTELGSVVDNPIIFADADDVVSAGNFHGQPLAFALDFMAIAITELASISERRTDRMLDPQHSCGLPPFLAARPGLNSGYMVAQYMAAALVAENRVLAHPASVESIPTSGSQEDHVSMGWGAGRKLENVLANTAHVLAAEMLCAAQGIEYRAPLQPASGTARAVALIRASVPPLDDDRPISDELQLVAAMIRSGVFEEL